MIEKHPTRKVQSPESFVLLQYLENHHLDNINHWQRNCRAVLDEPNEMPPAYPQDLPDDPTPPPSLKECFADFGKKAKPQSLSDALGLTDSPDNEDDDLAPLEALAKHASETETPNEPEACQNGSSEPKPGLFDVVRQWLALLREYKLKSLEIRTQRKAKEDEWRHEWKECYGRKMRKLAEIQAVVAVETANAQFIREMYQDFPLVFNEED